MMPFFAPLNASDSYLVKEFDMCDIDNKKIKDAFKNTLSFTNSLGLLPKE